MTAGLDLGLFRRRRVRLVRQTEVAECGLACLAMVANYHGMNVDLSNLRRRFQPSQRGATLKSTLSAADGLGFAPRAIKLPLEQLGQLHLPAILHWDMNHFVVLESIRGTRALIHNPIGRSERLPLASVSNHFTGVALELRPTDDFQPEQDRQRLRLPQLWRRITGLKRALFQTLVLSVVMQIFILASPYYMQVAIDSAIPALDGDLLTVLAIGFGLFTLINAGTTLLRSFVLLSAGTALGFGVSINLARRLFRLPVAWFDRRHVGDVLARFQSVSPIRQFMTEGAVAALLDGAMSVLTLIVMFFYSPELAFIAILAFVLYAVIRLLTFSAQRHAQEEAIMLASMEQSVLIESVRGIVTFRLFNKESQRHALWQSRLTDSMNAGVRLSRIDAWQQTANAFIFGMETILAIWLAVGSVIEGGFSVGMVFAYLAYKTQFLEKSASLVDRGITFRMLELHLERLSDIALAEQDISFTIEPDTHHPLLEGRIELRQVQFRYSPSDPLVLIGVDLTVEPGEHVAITGPSGGGKSTLVKVLLGLVQPSEGEILIDGVPLAAFGYKNYHDRIGAVLQDDNVFAGSLVENVVLFDEIPDIQRVEECCKAAALHDDILTMPMRYETLLGDMGSSLSGGQRQRLLLARALYRRPRVLVMDEGTSALDPAREKMVNDAIAEMGITRIVIAHRLETILNASRILTMLDGRLHDVTDQYLQMRKQIRGDFDIDCP